MLTKMQKEIIKATSTILFESDEEGAKYWLRDTFNPEDWYRRVVIEGRDDTSTKYNLFTIMIGNDIHIAVEVLYYDECGEADGSNILGTVRINQNRAQWDMVNYICMIENIIDNRCS